MPIRCDWLLLPLSLIQNDDSACQLVLKSDKHATPNVFLLFTSCYFWSSKFYWQIAIVLCLRSNHHAPVSVGVFLSCSHTLSPFSYTSEIGREPKNILDFHINFSQPRNSLSFTTLNQVHIEIQSRNGKAPVASICCLISYQRILPLPESLILPKVIDLQVSFSTEVILLLLLKGSDMQINK